MINMFKRALLALSLLLPAPAFAGVSCILPFTLTNGTTADATQVMANYNALVTCLGNAASAGVNSDITVLSGLTTPLSPAEGGASMFFGGTSTGSANAQAVSVTPNGFALTAGYQALFTAGFTNTGATTLNIASTGAKNVFRRAPGGKEALAGGEIQSGSQYVVSYDGTQFEILSNSAEFGGFSNQSAIASAATTDLGTLPSHHAVITGTNAITSFGSSASVSYPFYLMRFGGVLTLTNSANLQLPGSQNITTAGSDTALAIYLGGGQWQVSFYQRQATGQAIFPPTVDMQVFTATGASTWTRPASITATQVYICGAGGGGAGGARSAAATVAVGGGGGGGGGCAIQTFKGTDAGPSQTVTIGTGGTAGAGATSNGSAGTNGGTGGNSTFGGLLTGFGGGPGFANTPSGSGGGGGSSTAAGLIGSANNGGVSDLVPSGVATSGLFPDCKGAAGGSLNLGTRTCPGGGGGGGASDNTGLNPGGTGGNATWLGAGGGGGGGTTTSGNVGSTAGGGGKTQGCPTSPAGGAAGANNGGSTAPNFNYQAGCGGGGGGGANGSGLSGGAGGAGTNGGGGGGGGSGDNANAGAGGAGGNGFAIVISW